MIHISTGPADPGEILIKFPEYAKTINGERCVPEIRLSRPTTPSRKAAEMEAWRMVPVPNQDESDEEGEEDDDSEEDEEDDDDEAEDSEEEEEEAPPPQAKGKRKAGHAVTSATMAAPSSGKKSRR